MGHIHPLAYHFCSSSRPCFLLFPPERKTQQRKWAESIFFFAKVLPPTSLLFQSPLVIDIHLLFSRLFVPFRRPRYSSPSFLLFSLFCLSSAQFIRAEPRNRNTDIKAERTPLLHSNQCIKAMRICPRVGVDRQSSGSWGVVIETFYSHWWHEARPFIWLFRFPVPGVKGCRAYAHSHTHGKSNNQLWLDVYICFSVCRHVGFY